MDIKVDIRWEQAGGCTVVAPAASVAPGELRTALLQAAADDDAVVCDLGHGAAAADADRAEGLLDAVAAVADLVSSWPSALLVVVTGSAGALPPAARERRSPALAVAPDLRRAAALVAARPAALTARSSLEPRLQAPALARAFLRGTLAPWGDGDHLDDALVVADELVANAVLHAGTGMELRLSLLGACLGVAVADRSPRLPALGDPGATAESGRGVLLVDALASAWHVLPRRDGGKVVRAVLTAREGAGVQAPVSGPSTPHETRGPRRPGE